MTGEYPQDLRAVLESTAARHGDRIAIIMGSQEVTFAQLEADSSRFACGLLKMGLKKGERVAMLLSNSPQFASVFFGIIKAGGIAVPLDLRYVPDELASLFDDCQPRFLVIEEPTLSTLKPALSRLATGRQIIAVGAQETGRFSRYEEIIAENPPQAPSIPVSPQDIAVISYTGGATFSPHGVALAQQSLGIEAACSAEAMAQTEDDIMLLFALPMYHQFGLTAVLLSSIYCASKVVIVPGTGRSVHSFLEAIARYKGTIYCGVPYIYSLMVNVARREGVKHDLSSVRLFISGGAPLEPVVIRLFQQYYGAAILDVYGQTETVCHVTMMPPGRLDKIGSSGKPLACWEIKIFDEDDRELPPGKEGEIVVRGPVMRGFYNKPEATARVMRNGWLHTGDIGKLDEEGFLYITGRKRRMLILKGQNVFPADIEKVLLTHPDIARAKVMGVTDLVRGETVKALVKLKPGKSLTAQEVRQYCQGRIADYKLPRDVEFVDTVPEEVPLWRRLNFEAADLMPEEAG